MKIKFTKMVRKYLFIGLIIYGCFMSCHGATNKDSKDGNLSETINAINKDLSLLLAKYDTSRVFNSYYFLYNSSFPVLPKNLSSDSLCNPVSSTVFDNKYFFCLKIDSIISTKKETSIIDGLTRWCENEAILNILVESKINNKGQIYFEQLVADIKETKRILQKYIKGEEQYWGSLDTGQSCSYYFDVLQYLQDIPEKKRVLFFKVYLNKALDMLLKN